MDEHDRLVADIYDAALNDWARAPAVLARCVGAGSAVVWTATNDGCVEAETFGLPDEASRLYIDRYSRLDPWFQAAHRRGLLLRVVRGADMVSELQFRQTEFYADFARRVDTVRAVGCEIPFASGHIGGIGAHRGAGARRFDRRQAEHVQRLVPHFQRALQIRRRLGRIAVSHVGIDALDALAEGILVCDAAGRVQFANAAAAALANAKTGLVLGRTGIAAVDTAQSLRLSRLVHDACTGGAGGAALITGPSDKRLFALVAPLPLGVADAARLPPVGKALALVAIRLADAMPVVPSSALVQLFGLTGAEARVALSLLEGSSIEEVAAIRDVTLNTVRTQLAAILRKTGTRSQRDLVRVLSLLPSLLTPNEGRG